MLIRVGTFCFPALLLFLSCNSVKKENPPAEIPSPAAKSNPEPVPEQKNTTLQYQLITPKDSIKKFLKEADSSSVAIIALVNRADKRSLRNFDSIVAPADTRQDLKNYFPFPHNAAFLKEVKKIIFFSYPTQAFAAYENGILVRTGPTSMGKRFTQTGKLKKRSVP